ncbi:MAG: antibiotic biosynthesis monooxygenase [Pirellulales bacterium]
MPERIKAAGLAEKPFTLVVVFSTKPESAGKLDPLVQRGATETHKEKDCLLYDAHKNPEVPGQYVFLERFQGIAGLEAHVATDYTKDLLAAFAAEATAPPKISIVDQVSPTRK